MSTKSDISDEQGYMRAQFCLTTIEALSGQKIFFRQNFVWNQLLACWSEHTSQLLISPPQLPDMGFLLNNTPMLMPNILMTTTQIPNNTLINITNTYPGCQI